jgi:hypothetical protein
MASHPRQVDSHPADLRERNRRTARVLLAVLSALVLATLLIGIRW